MTSTQVRNETYYKVLGSLIKSRKRVFEAITELGEATNNQIADHLGLKINQVTGRVTELQEMFLIKGTKSEKGKQTGFQHTVWATIPEDQREELFKRFVNDSETKIERLSDDLEQMVSGVDHNYCQESRDAVIKKMNSLSNRLKRIRKVWNS